MRLSSIVRWFLGSAVASVALMGVTGCGVSSATPTSLPFSTGNWQFVAKQNTPGLPALSGSLTGASANISGLLHVDGNGACVPESEVIEVSGSTDQFGVINLVGTLAGGSLTIQGVMAADGKSIVDSGYFVTGGSCALSATYANGQYYSPISGTYAGVFKDGSGLSSILNASFSQSPQSDLNGNFSLSGTGSFAANPCITGSGQWTQTQVTGGGFKLMYVDSSNQESISLTGQFSPDGTTLVITSWTLTGGCGSDSGTGLLSR